jgi:hypothetical protein
MGGPMDRPFVLARKSLSVPGAISSANSPGGRAPTSAAHSELIGLNVFSSVQKACFLIDQRMFRVWRRPVCLPKIRNALDLPTVVTPNIRFLYIWEDIFNGLF